MKVAIVDDDDSVCRSLVRLLQHAGMSPSVFGSAADFLAARPHSFGCLLVDVQLGNGMSGLELHRWLLEHGDRTPVIYLTANDDPAVESDARRMGCAAFVRKGDPPKLMLQALLAIRNARTA